MLKFAIPAVLAVAIGAVAALLADPHLWERNHVAHAHPPRAIVFAPLNGARLRDPPLVATTALAARPQSEQKAAFADISVPQCEQGMTISPIVARARNEKRRAGSTGAACERNRRRHASGNSALVAWA